MTNYKQTYYNQIIILKSAHRKAPGRGVWKMATPKDIPRAVKKLSLKKKTLSYATKLGIPPCL